MKRFLLLTAALLVLMLIVTVTPANPLKAFVLSELLFDKDGGWHMEIAAHVPSLDGCYLKSKTDSAVFKDGLGFNTSGFCVLSNDSLKKPFSINPLGDSITFFAQGRQMDGLTFGREDWKNVYTPRYGQSICQNQQGYYLDNTPTLGAANDILNAEGTIQFLVQDSLGHSLTSAYISYHLSWDDMGKICYTNSSGVASATMIARRMWFYVHATGYTSQQVWMQSYPESTITVPVTLAFVPQAVEGFGITSPGSFALDNPYPNPFNPAVTVEYTLPRNGPVEIHVFDVAGKLVSEIFSGRQPAGKNVARWEAVAYPSGVYLIRVKTGDGMALKKCLLLK